MTSEHVSSVWSINPPCIHSNWQRLSDIADARKDEQFKNMDMRFTSIDKKIKAIKSTLSRIMWLVLGFMIKGGFNLP